MAIKEGEQGTQMKYIYFDGLDSEPPLWSGEFLDARDAVVGEAVVKEKQRQVSGEECTGSPGL